ncbi:MAG: protein-L-isoaspartate O-methyltransferase [Maricaulaceae bacterium]
MLDFASARAAMVAAQIRPANVTQKALLDAMAAIPRERFAPKSQAAFAYADMDVTLGEGRWMLRPRVFARLVEALEVQASDLALVIACGRGYGVAVLTRLADMVVGLEPEPSFVDKAGAVLAEIGIVNAAVLHGDLRAGAPDAGPFDVVLVEGAVAKPAAAWFDQLKDGGRLAVVEKTGALGQAMIYEKSAGAVGGRAVFDAAAPVLAGFEPETAFAL